LYLELFPGCEVGSDFVLVEHAILLKAKNVSRPSVYITIVDRELYTYDLVAQLLRQGEEA
jgi:hypothetical protein